MYDASVDGCNSTKEVTNSYLLVPCVWSTALPSLEQGDALERITSCLPLRKILSHVVPLGSKQDTKHSCSFSSLLLQERKNEVTGVRLISAPGGRNSVRSLIGVVS